MVAGAENKGVVAPVLQVSEGLGEIGDHVSGKGKVKSFRISEHGQNALSPPDDDSTPNERFAWTFRNAIEVACDIRVELETGLVFRWLSDPDLEGYEIAQRVQMATLIREAFLSNRSVVIHGVVEEIPTPGRPSSPLTVNRARAVEVVGVNL